MLPTNHHNLVMALENDLARVKFKKVKKSPITNASHFVSFDYGGRYAIEVSLENYHTTMWHYNGDEHNLLLTSNIDEELASIGKKLINAHLNEILNAK